MTLITFQDGKPVLRDGAVGTEPECCCERCPCDEYKILCIQQVFSYYNVVWTQGGNANPMTPENIPADQPAGTFLVLGQLGGCPGTPNLPQDHLFFPGAACFNSSDPFRTPGAAAARTQWYYRYRLVDDCSECVSDIDEDVIGECDIGAVVVSCSPFNETLCLQNKPCIDAAGIEPCANPLP